MLSRARRRPGVAGKPGRNQPPDRGDLAGVGGRVGNRAAGCTGTCSYQVGSRHWLIATRDVALCCRTKA